LVSQQLEVRLPWDISNTNTLLNGEMIRTKLFDDLTWLNVSGTGVSDAELVAIRNLSKLTELDISNTTVTDKGLEELARLLRLDILNIEGTKATPAGKSRLEALRSNEVGTPARLQPKPKIEPFGLH
jgi:hypothetical protein